MQKTEHLDGLRGFAALVVIFGHCSNVGMHLIPGLDVSATAKAGVWLFFVLSAYLLTRRFLDAPSAPSVSDLVNYGSRRFFRIMPAYTLVLAGLWLAGAMGTGALAGHLLLLRGRDHFWTIPVEMSFYVVLPIAVFALFVAGRRTIPVLFVGLAFAAYFLADPGKIAANSLDLLNYLFFFVSGILVACLPRSRLSSQSSLFICLLTFGLLILFSPRVFGYLFSMPIEAALKWSWVYAILWATVIYVSGQAAYVREFLQSPFLRFVGAISFSLYLVHFDLIHFVSQWSSVPIELQGWIVVALSAALATAIYLAVELPFMRIGRLVTEGLIGYALPASAPRAGGHGQEAIPQPDTKPTSQTI